MGKNNQYIMSEQELRRLQQTQLELILEVKRICEKNHIHFNMVGGTMLGAIRHKGYIPWDDDSDIGFLREEYEKFREACKTDLNQDKYYIQDFRDTEGYRWGYGKLRKKGTKFLRLNQEEMPYEQGICIDLMPFDNIPDNAIARKIHKGICFAYRKVFWSAIGRNTEKNAVIRLLYRGLYHIPESTVKKSYENFIRFNRHRRTKQVRILTFPTPEGVDGYERRWYTELSRYSFEGQLLPGAKDYEGYLSVKYGNFMEIPPVEKQKVHPVSKLELGEEVI